MIRRSAAYDFCIGYMCNCPEVSGMIIYSNGGTAIHLKRSGAGVSGAIEFFQKINQ
jgi:hypothetical protein